MIQASTFPEPPNEALRSSSTTCVRMDSFLRRRRESNLCSRSFPSTCLRTRDSVSVSRLTPLSHTCFSCIALHGGVLGKDYVSPAHMYSFSSSYCSATVSQDVYAYYVAYKATAVAESTPSPSNPLAGNTAVSAYFTGGASATQTKPGATGPAGSSASTGASCYAVGLGSASLALTALVAALLL